MKKYTCFHSALHHAVVWIPRGARIPGNDRADQELVTDKAGWYFEWEGVLVANSRERTEGLAIAAYGQFNGHGM